MKRQGTLEEISDGKLYEWNDMVKAGCHNCKGCHDCCQGMGKSVILDPLDTYRLMKNLNMAMEELLADKLELQIVDGVALPNLKMDGANENCRFLNSSGRCSIHAFRPGFCRMFPLGRYYENRSFHYILQVHECPMENKTKVKVGKWVDIPDRETNEQFVLDWHYFILDLQRAAQAEEDSVVKNMNLYILNQFFMKPYQMDTEFYPQFYARLKEAKELLGLDWT